MWWLPRRLYVKREKVIDPILVSDLNRFHPPLPPALIAPPHVACSASLRRKGSGFLRVAIERWPQATLRVTLPPIMRQMRDALFDTDATVRREGRHTFGVFIRLW